MNLEYEITTRTYKSFDLKDCILLIHLSQNSIHLSVYYPARNEFLSLKSYEFEISTFEQAPNIFTYNIPEFSQPFHKRILSYNNLFFTLIPELFWKPGLKEHYYKINFDKKKNDIINSEYLEQLNLYLIYSIDNKYNKLIQALKPDTLFHSVNVHLNYYTRLQTFTKSTKVYIDIDKDFFSFYIFLNSKLELCNSFKYKNSEDILYHILNISKILHLNPEEEHYYISGYIERNSELFNLLYKYLRFLHLVVKPDKFYFSEEFDNLTYHKFHNLFILSLCV